MLQVFAGLECLWIFFSFLLMHVWHCIVSSLDGRREEEKRWGPTVDRGGDILV
jgi:hypothetical protein